MCETGFAFEACCAQGLPIRCVHMRGASCVEIGLVFAARETGKEGPRARPRPGVHSITGVRPAYYRRIAMAKRDNTPAIRR